MGGYSVPLDESTYVKGPPPVVGPMKGVIQTPEIAKIFQSTPDIETTSKRHKKNLDLWCVKCLGRVLYPSK